MHWLLDFTYSSELLALTVPTHTRVSAEHNFQNRLLVNISKMISNSENTLIYVLVGN
jgi:hypothetical protein